jgi:hypothetical protein
MSLLLFKNLAKYVAKSIVLAIMITFVVSIANGQKKQRPKKNVSKKTAMVRVHKKIRRPEPKRYISPVLPKILVPSEPLHRELHYTEESWTDAMASKFIIVSFRPNGGILSYRVMHDATEELFSIKVDSETAYLVPVKEKNGDLEGCFMMAYCKVHNTALILSQVQCF